MNKDERNRKRRAQYHLMKQIDNQQIELSHIERYNRNYIPGIIALSLFYNDPTIIWPARHISPKNIIINDHIVGNSDW